MPYALQATSQAPSLVFLLIDTGAAMNKSIDGEHPIDKMNRQVRRILQRLVQRSTKGEIVSDRYDLAIVAYGDAPVDALGQIESIQAVARRGQPMFQGYGKSNALAAFAYAQRILTEELPRRKPGPAPLIVHFSSCMWTGPDPEPLVREIMRLGTDDGKILVENVCCGCGFPDASEAVTEAEFENEALRTLFRMSSVLPDSWVEQIQNEGHVVAGGRRMMFPGDSPLVELTLPLSSATPTRLDGPQRDAEQTGARTLPRRFYPEPGDSLPVFGQTYLVQEHPWPRGMTFCAEGGKASVYQLKDEWGGAFALKVFFPRFRTARTVLAANRLNLLGGMPGLQAARRAVIASDDPILHRHADLKYAVLMPWIGGPTWWDYLENSRHKKTDAAAAFRLAACLLEVIAGFEKRGMAHSDLCAANIIIDFERRDLQVVDLEDMYMPGVPNPVLRTTGQVGYQHPSGETTWNPAGDRFASAVLAAEVLLSAIPDAELSGGLFGWDVTAARERFLRADNLLAHWYAGFARLFRQSWASSTLLRCPSVADLHAALVDDGPAGSPTRDTVIIPVVAHANGAQDRAKPKRIFISYSHSDARFRDELLKHLMSLKREGLVEAWHDQDIAAGMEWEKEIVEQLLGADVILLLISADFLSSDYCYGREMQTALRLHQERSASVIPVIVRDVDWQNSPFASLEAVPVKNARVFPLNRWSSRDAAWLNVVLAIRRLVSA